MAGDDDNVVLGDLLRFGAGLSTVPAVCCAVVVVVVVVVAVVMLVSAIVPGVEVAASSSLSGCENTDSVTSRGCSSH